MVSHFPCQRASGGFPSHELLRNRPSWFLLGLVMSDFLSQWVSLAKAQLTTEGFRPRNGLLGFWTTTHLPVTDQLLLVAWKTTWGIAPTRREPSFGQRLVANRPF